MWQGEEVCSIFVCVRRWLYSTVVFRLKYSDPVVYGHSPTFTWHPRDLEITGWDFRVSEFWFYALGSMIRLIHIMENRTVTTKMCLKFLQLMCCSFKHFYNYKQSLWEIYFSQVQNMFLKCRSSQRVYGNLNLTSIALFFPHTLVIHFNIPDWR